MATIQDYSKAYEAAKKNNDKIGMDAAHAAADKIRGYGTTTQVVNGAYKQVRTTPEVKEEIPTVDKPSGYKPTLVKDNSQAAKAAYIQSQLGALGMNYATNKANMDNSYNRNLANAGTQKDIVNDQFGDIKQQIGQENFNNMRYNKQMGAARGITSSAQMLGADVATQRAGNSATFAAEKDKNLAINGIQTFISQLGEAYGVDQQTLESNYGTAKLKAMSDGELMALESQLKVDMFNAGSLNQFSLSDKNYSQNLGLTQMQNEFTSGQNAINRDFTSSEADKTRNFTANENALNRDASARLSSAGNNASLQLARLNINAQSSMFDKQQAAEIIQDYTGAALVDLENSGQLTNVQMNRMRSLAYDSASSGNAELFKTALAQYLSAPTGGV